MYSAALAKRDREYKEEQKENIGLLDEVFVLQEILENRDRERREAACEIAILVELLRAVEFLRPDLEYSTRHQNKLIQRRLECLIHVLYPGENSAVRQKLKEVALAELEKDAGKSLRHIAS